MIMINNVFKNVTENSFKQVDIYRPETELTRKILKLKVITPNAIKNMNDTSNLFIKYLENL